MAGLDGRSICDSEVLFVCFEKPEEFSGLAVLAPAPIQQCVKDSLCPHPRQRFCHVYF